MNERSSLFWGLLALALAMVVSAAIGSSAILRAKRSGDTINVTGSARMRVASDYVTWSINLQKNEPTLEGASTALLRDRTRTLAFLRKQGLPDSVITVQALNSWVQMETNASGRETGRVLLYRANQMITVRSSDVQGVTAIARAIEELTRQGVALNAQQPQYHYTGLDEARIALMADATRDAKARATEIANAAGGEVGPIRSARMGVIQVVAPHSTQVSSYGIYDTSTIEKDVVAVVKVDFAVH